MTQLQIDPAADLARSRTRTRIVEAAARLLTEHGLAAMTTRDVASAAGVQPPAIYRLFGDKDGLLEAVAEHTMAAFVANKAETVNAATDGGLDPVEDLRAGWDTYLSFGLANPTLFTLMSDPGRAARSPAVAIGRTVLAARVHRIAAAGRLRVAEEQAADLLHAAGTGATLTLLAVPPERRATDLAASMLDAVLQVILDEMPVRPVVAPASAALTLLANLEQLDPLSAAERGLLAEWLQRLTPGH